VENGAIIAFWRGGLDEVGSLKTAGWFYREQKNLAAYRQGFL